MRRALSIVLLLALPAMAQTPPDAEVGCRVCHPGAVRALRRSPHAALLQQPAKACAACHGDLSAHATHAGAAGASTSVLPVAGSTCAACHPGRDLPPQLATHALQDTGSGAAAPPPPARLTELLQQADDPALRWSGFVELGYRILHRDGGKSGYRTDVDLDPGLRLSDFELRGRGGDAAAVDELAFAAHDLGDPRWDAGASVHATDRFEFAGSYRADRFRYRADGDYHRVDRDGREARSDASVQLGAVKLFGSYTHRDDEGFWLTQRIGERNLPVQTVVDGVESPRHTSSDAGELGLAGRAGGLHWTLAGSWFEQHQLDRWHYLQPAAANPAFPAGEDFASRTSLHGPGARAQLAGDLGPLGFDVRGRFVELHRDLDAAGTSAGYDVAAYTTTTAATGAGHSRTWLVDADLQLPRDGAVRLAAELHWRDHDEVMRLDQRDVSTWPSLSTVVTVDTIADNQTAQRLFDGALRLEVAPSSDLELSLGYGFCREQLRVPDLQPQDPLDYRTGHRRDDGVLADARWRFCSEWTLRTDLRLFGADGVPLHELTPERARTVGASLAYQSGAIHANASLRHRRSENDTSRHHLDSFAAGGSFGVTAGSSSLDASYGFARSDVRTLTNFYFDPDPTPAPTLVGFHGDTHTLSATLATSPAPSLRAELAAAFTATTGSFDVRTLDWRVGLHWAATARGTVGAELRDLRYHDAGGGDDFHAAMLWLSWRQDW